VTETALDLGFERRGERTALVRRVFRWPYVVMRPFRLDAAPAHMTTVVVQSSGAALQRGDRLRQSIGVGESAAAHVTTQGAQAAHAAKDERIAEETVSLHVARGGYLEYLPEPRILFPGADVLCQLDLDCAADGVALISDAFAWHDPEGMQRTPRRLRSTMTLRIDGGRAAAIERTDISRFAPRLGGFAAFGTMALVAPGRIDSGACADVNAALGRIEGLYAAASLLPGAIGVGLRFAGRDLRAVRAGLHLGWSWSRTLLSGAPPPGRRKESSP
jgi:urease accessory protein